MDTFLSGNQGYTHKQLKATIKAHYGDEIVVTSIVGKSSIISFRDCANTILHDKWIAYKVIYVNEQSNRIIEMAASIILNDIRTAVYDVDEYILLEATENVDTMTSSSLKHFLN